MELRIADCELRIAEHASRAWRHPRASLQSVACRPEGARSLPGPSGPGRPHLFQTRPEGGRKSTIARFARPPGGLIRGVPSPGTEVPGNDRTPAGRSGRGELQLAAVLLLTVVAPVALAQQHRTHYRIDPYVVHSGVHHGAESETLVAFAQTIHVPNAPWLRLSLRDYELGRESFMLIRSVATGAEQRMTHTALENWRNNTAFFGGDALEVELHVAPGERNIFIETSAVWVGQPLGPDDPNFADPESGDQPEGGGDPPEDLCGGDSRVASTDSRVGRLFGGGCTAFLVANGAFVTAGHCVDGQPDGVVDQGFLDTVVEFNVPPSLPNGATQPALPDDQFPVTGIYVAWQFIGIGADWAVFHAGPNADGVTPQQAQGGFFRVSGAAESTIGQTMRVTGYGWDWTPAGTSANHCLGGSNAGASCIADAQCPGGNCVAPFCCDGNQNMVCDFNCNSHSATQQTATGPCTDFEDNGSTAWFRYELDTTPATSGSAVVREATGEALGINTNSDTLCNDGGNWGMTFDQDVLHDFLNVYIYGPGVAYADPTSFCVLGFCSGTIFNPHPTISEAVSDVSDNGNVVIIQGNYTAASGNVFTAGADGKAMTFIAPFGGVVIGN